MATFITITNDYITLGQLLKLANVVSSGGQIKHFLTNTNVLVNDVAENRRGKKLRVNDIVNVNNQTFVIKAKE